MKFDRLPDLPTATLLPPLPQELFWPFVITMVLFIVAIHLHAYLRD